jgi:serine/threonine protein kinase
VSRGSQETIGPYRLVNLIMTGQTSQVWEVVHEATRERLALKLLLSDFRKQREHLGYLKHEFEVGRTLQHPRVIKLHEMGSDRGITYLVMEYFPFPNMKVWIRRGYDQIAVHVPKIIEQAAEGLAYFNAQGWIHRDVKPENFLVSPEGEVRLIDFALAEKRRAGLARLFGGRSKIQGTRSYISPEQIRGQPLDQRADVYSFGCTIYELLVGKPPFAGGDSDDLLRKHLRTPAPSIAAYNRNVTPEFAELVKRLLAKAPQDRPEDLTKFLREFKKIRVFRVTPRMPAEMRQSESAG